jgi:hypothetical protein
VNTNSKLILIEGIPGSGKTNTARFVCDWLEQHGQLPRLFLEGDVDHPADYESVACLDETEYREIAAQFPGQIGLLPGCSWHEKGEWFIRYRKMEQESGTHVLAAFMDALRRFEIYDLPAGKFQRLLLNSWQRFAAQAAKEPFVYVFECCFLQNPITTSLARHNLPKAVIRQHLEALADAIRPLQPKLIYLQQTDPKTTLEKIRHERPTKWADYVTWYLTGQAYGRAHGLEGYAGVIDFYTLRQQLELEYLPDLSIPAAILSSDDTWLTRYEQLTPFLER